MKVIQKISNVLGGWSGASILLIIYIASELGSCNIEGDWGGILYVALHFIVIPIFSVLIIGFTFIKLYFSDQMQRTFLLLSSSTIIPIIIIYIACSGNPFLIKLLSPCF